MDVNEMITTIFQTSSHHNSDTLVDSFLTITYHNIAQHMYISTTLQAQSSLAFRSAHHLTFYNPTLELSGGPK